MSQDSKKRDEFFEEDLRGYAWDYFALHSDQRMKTFHFYIIMATALIGGLAVLIKSGETRKWMSIFGISLFFFSFLFWKLDLRNRQLIKNAERALMLLDGRLDLVGENGNSHPLMLFACDASETKDSNSFPLFSGHFSYARVLRWIFLFFSLVGIAATIYFLGFTPL